MNAPAITGINIAQRIYLKSGCMKIGVVVFFFFFFFFFFFLGGGGGLGWVLLQSLPWFLFTVYFTGVVLSVDGLCMYIICLKGDVSSMFFYFQMQS